MVTDRGSGDLVPTIDRMSTKNVSLPNFQQDLIRKTQERQRVRCLILEGMASPRIVEANTDYFKKLRARSGKHFPISASSEQS